MRTALALSPHLDDAAFSAGGTLAALAEAGWRVVVATVFTRSVPRPHGFALACQTDKGLPPEADYMAIRRAEDDAACAALGAAPRHLPFAEAPHRGYDGPAALFAGLHRGDAIVETLRPALCDLVRAVAPDRLYLPRCVGAHVDHLAVRRAAEGIEAPERWYWTDWPYAGRAEAPDPFASEDAARRAEDVAIEPERAKLAACAAYATQLGYQFGGAEAMRAQIGAVRTERFLRG